MPDFPGLPDGKITFARIPELFFSQLLPQIDHLGELKVTLHIFWLLTRKRGDRPGVSDRELAADYHLLDGLSLPGVSPLGVPPLEALRDALERAVARGTLLRVTVGEGAQQRAWYFVNSEKGRRAVEDLLAGRWTPGEAAESVQVQAARPNIFVLYEQNIGPLTPLLAEELMEAENTYPPDWIKDAFREAVELNKRSWRYIQRILERWAAEGKTDETSRPSDERDRRRFIEGEYAEFIEH